MIGLSEAKKLLTRQTVGGIVTGGEQCTITWEQARAIKELLGPEIEHCWHDTSDEELNGFVRYLQRKVEEHGDSPFNPLMDIVLSHFMHDNKLASASALSSNLGLPMEAWQKAKSAIIEMMRRGNRP